MKKLLPVLTAVCLLLTGCASLLARSYSVVEPYINRYLDPGAEDTLKAETSQDLVNTLLLLVEQRAEEGVIRYYTEEDVYSIADQARREVCGETVPGSYLLRSMTFSSEAGEGYFTLTYNMVYREDAEDIDSLISLSDSQSLVDLLRLSIRERHEKMTARFSYETAHREDVIAVAEGLWQELYRSSLEEEEPQEEASQPDASAETGEAPSAAEGTGMEEAGEGSEGIPKEATEPAEGAPGEESSQAQEPPTEPEISYPPCPWEIRFYPDTSYVGIVEILLKETPESIVLEVSGIE